MKTNDTTLLTVRTKKSVKELAQMRARQLGIPLGTIINAYLRYLGHTGEVHFVAVEQVTPEMAKVLDELRAEVARGETDGPFTIDEAEKFLDSIPYEG